MSDRPEIAASTFCDDSELDYLRYRTPLPRGTRLKFDEAYRLAHLPLVAPDHPSVINTKPGSGYNMGRHDLVYSIGIPVPAGKLLTSSAFIELEEELKSSNFLLCRVPQLN